LVIVAGPTASGKSALAMALAGRLGGTVINADAMQCYRELRVLTARPSAADEAAVPHALYGVKAAAEPANAAWWRGAALAALDSCEMPILCGGTGMYLAALLHGIAEIPEIAPLAREEARGLVAALGPEALHRRLLAVDPATAETLFVTDSQRIARAWEVWRSTGRGLAWWQRQPTQGLQGFEVRMILLDPPREALRAAIAGRFGGMLEAGALEEVQALLALGLAPDLPLLRAHGVPELGAYLRGEMSLAAATAKAVLVTSQYTKRQSTWFRLQKLVDKSALHIIHARIDGFTQFSESFMDDLVNFINMPG
jgi:tRNA dimethylallyltransferase